MREERRVLVRDVRAAGDLGYAMAALEEVRGRTKRAVDGMPAAMLVSRAHGPNSTHIVCEDGDSAAISLLGTQSLEDLRGAIGMLLQPALDDWLVRIELALSPGSEVLTVGLLARPTLRPSLHRGSTHGKA